MRWIIFATLISLSGCATAQGQLGPTNSANSMEATQRANFPAQCEIAPLFPGTPKPMPRDLNLPPGEFYGWRYDSGTDLGFNSICSCPADLVPKNISERLAQATFSSNAEKMNGRIDNFKFASGFGTNVAKVSLIIDPSPYGPLRVLTETYYFEKCAVEVKGVFKESAPEKRADVEAFFATLRPISARPLVPHANSPKTSSKGNGASSRENRLKEVELLLRKKLITREEYDKKRKDILDEL